MKHDLAESWTSAQAIFSVGTIQLKYHLAVLSQSTNVPNLIPRQIYGHTIHIIYVYV